MRQRKRGAVSYSKILVELNQAQSDEDLKKIVSQLAEKILAQGTQESITYWNEQKEEIYASLNQAPLEVQPLKAMINKLIRDLSKIKSNANKDLVSSSASNKPTANLYERISHFVQARKEHRAILRQEKNDQLNKIDEIIRKLHLIKKSLVPKMNESVLIDLKKEVYLLKDNIMKISKSRAYQKSNTVMMNTDSAINKFSTINNQIDKKLMLLKVKKRAKVQSIGLMRKLVDKATQKKAKTETDDLPPHFLNKP